MSKLLYVATRMDIAEFLKGSNPTTQPGVMFDYYPSLFGAMNHLKEPQSIKQTLSMGDWITVPNPRDVCCVMGFEAEDIYLQPNNTESSVGSGVLNPQHLSYAMIMMTNPSRTITPADNIFFEGTTWDEVRAEVQKYQREAFMRGGLKQTENTEFTLCDRHGEKTYNVSLVASKLLPENREVCDAYEKTSGTEQQRIICALKSNWDSVSQTPEEYFKERINFELWYGSIPRHEINEYASMHLACLPNDIKDIAINIFDTKMYELGLDGQFGEEINETYDDYYDARNNIGNDEIASIHRCTAIAIACAIESVLPMVEQQYPELLADVIDSGKEAMQTAIKLGASERDMVVENREDMILDNATPNNDLSDSFDEV